MYRTTNRTTERLIAIIICFALIVATSCGEPVSADESDKVAQAKHYTYTLEPALAPFNNYLLLKTDNPDVSDIRIIDRDVSGREEGCIAVMTPTKRRFTDVVYEDEQSLRTAGGYIIGHYVFSELATDGGEMTLQVMTDSWNGTYEDVAILTCPPLTDVTQYLIDAYTAPSMSFFEKLDAVQNALEEIAVYPFSLLDSERPNEERPYPFFATSPHIELGFNEHYEGMFAQNEGGLLACRLYPFLLDSWGFPGEIAAVAKVLEPTCEIGIVEQDHAERTVTFAGETRQYGGQGRGGNNPLYTERITDRFRFDGGEGDAARLDLNGLQALLMTYKRQANEDNRQISQMLSGEALVNGIGTGSWVRVAVEGTVAGTTFGYMALSNDGTGGYIASDAWVDGRYVDRHESVQLHTTFEEHPTADIILRNMEYTDINGQTHVSDVVFNYDTKTDTWRAMLYYVRRNWYTVGTPLPEEMIITRQQAEGMGLDCNTDHLPENGKVYDGTLYPGTPFENRLVTGLSLPEQLTMYVDDSLSPATVEPADPFDSRVRWSFSQEGILSYGIDGSIYALAPGTVTATATTVDGGYTKSCTITVEKLTGWQKREDGNTYYYGEDGKKHKGWLELDGESYYLGPELYTDGFYTINGRLYCMDETGKCRTGAVEMEGENYLFWPELRTGSVSRCIFGDDSYFVGEDGRLVSGFVEWNGGTLYFDPTTFTQHMGWLEADGKVYYCQYFDLCRSPMRCIDNVWYGFDQNGVLVWREDEQGNRIPVPFFEENGADGDVDGDGTVTSTDARLALQLAVELIDPEEVNGSEMGDVDGDGTVTSTDARMILQMSLTKTW